MKLQLDPWQKEFIATKGDKILCCGRQVGKTEICAHDCGEYVQNPDNPFPVLMTAPTERQAFNLFDKTLGYLLENYPQSVITKGAKRPTKTKIELKNGMKIYCLPVGASGLGIRGLTVGRSYEDDNSRIPDDVEDAIAPMVLTTGGARIKLSTPYGAKGEFWRTWINKDGAYDSYTRFSVTSETVIANREISETWTIERREAGLKIIEQAKKRLGTRAFAQEFLGEFMDDLFRFFPDKLIDECCVLDKKDSITHENDYFLGVDIARMGEDEGTYEVIEKIGPKLLHHVDNIITKKKLTTETHDLILKLDNLWDFKQIGIDAGSGSLGVGILDWLLRTDVRRKVVALNNVSRTLDYYETKAEKLLKEDMYQLMLSLMQQGVLKLLDDEEVVMSLRSVQYEYVQKQGQPTKIKIFGNYTHVVEGLIRAVWLANSKNINSFISYV